MLDTIKESQTTEWNRELVARVGGPIPYETLPSVLIVVPGNSGDVALVTSVVRHIKARNPRCRVSFAVKRSNLPLLKMCPGVDEAIEIPTLPFEKTPGRSTYLERYAGRAEAVIYPICVYEDLGLMRRFNFLETIWLLSGVPDGMPPGPHPLWLTPPDDPQIAARVLNRCLSREYADELAREARRQPGKVFRHLIEKRTIINAGWKNAGRLRRYAAYVREVAARHPPADAARRFVIVSSEANAVPPAPKGMFDAIFDLLRSQDRIILHNVIDPIHAAPGTIPLKCTYEEFLCLRQAGVPFVGWRSGLCDIAAASPTPMCVGYPGRMEEFWIGLAANCETSRKSFGFESMDIAANCTEIVCDSLAELNLGKLEAMLDTPKADNTGAALAQSAGVVAAR